MKEKRIISIRFRDIDRSQKIVERPQKNNDLSLWIE